MARPIFRLNVGVDRDTWEVLLETERFKGIETSDFFIETSGPSIWLCFVAKDHETVHRLRDSTSNAGGLPMKWAGELSESAELFNSYFRAAVEAAKVEHRVQDMGPDESSSLKGALEVAKSELEDARARFEAALKADARSAAEIEDVPQTFDESGDDEGAN